VAHQEGDNTVIIRHWIFGDAAGNYETCDQTIILTGCYDECEAPIIISCAPAEITLPCGSSIHPDDIGWPVVRKDDNCPAVVYYTYDEEAYHGAYNTVITRHWIFGDAAGNYETCDQTIILTGCKEGIDPKEPALDGSPSNPVVNVVLSPNPFRHEATINFTSEEDGKALVVVTDLAGHEIAKLFEGDVMKGDRQAIQWKPESMNGGLYFYRIVVNGYPTTGKILYRP
jgi:hypothetical protein